jgi:hypothetical protein
MTLGVVMLDTRFERFPGDIGHIASHPGPVLIEKVPGATAARVVGGIASLTDPAERAAALQPFIEAGRRLIANGATAITTSCGFLVAYQDELAHAFSVPVMTSSLCLLPEIDGKIADGQRIGVLTFNAEALGALHFRAAGYAKPTPVFGLAPDSHFRQAVLERAASESFAQREADVLDALDRLVASAPDLGVIVLECTNFPPHRAAIMERISLPLYDIWDVVERLTGRGRKS